ncbi:MAG: hypothetical protein JW940_29860 [Polyangiaceae bacterium]|nr:hypothetical protein [Polyangiaceae bacterium]
MPGYMVRRYARATCAIRWLWPLATVIALACAPQTVGVRGPTVGGNENNAAPAAQPPPQSPPQRTEQPTPGSVAASTCQPCPECTVAAPKPQTDGPLKLDAVPWCYVAGTSRNLAVQTIVTTVYVRPGGTRETSRLLWYIMCGPTNECRGASVRLGNIDEGRPLQVLDMGLMTGQIASWTPSRVVIQWGPWQTFTVDLAAGKVFYSESGEGAKGGDYEGRGEGRCG